MTIGEYVSQKMGAFNLNEAAMNDIMGSLGMPLDEEYTFALSASVGKAMTLAIEELVLAPRLSNVNEGGFSMSWDFSSLGRYYQYLCKKWGLPINDEVVAASGLSIITDRTNLW